MSIIIKGLNLPKEELNQERLTITIWANGCVTNDGDWVRNEDGTYRKEYWNYEQFSAVELPPHGDLIDRDALNNAFTGMRFNADGLLLHYGDRNDWYLKGSEVETLITNATTIIESE